MFTLGTVILILVFVGLLVGVPFRFKAQTSDVLERLRRKLSARATHAAFGSDDGKAWERLLKTRIWGITAVAFLFLLLVQQGSPFKNDPQTLASACLNAIGALVIAGFLTVMYEMVTRFLPALRADGLLSRFGYKGVWLMDPTSPARELRDGLATRFHGSTRVVIVDVTGHELIGKGPGPAGGLLYDTLHTLTAIPVQVLLLQPESVSPDVEQRRATVFQSVLAEMEVTPQNYVRRIRATLDAIQTLNEQRPTECKIEARFYTEKPSFRALLFDESILVSPWVPRESNAISCFLDVAKTAAETTLYSALRYQCARVWAMSANQQDAAQKANGFKSMAVRREPVPAQAFAARER